MSDVIVVGVTAPQAPATVVDVTGRPGTPGSAGYDGWTPVLATVPDGTRRVLQVQTWTGGEGLPPPAGLYVGATGLVEEIAEAIDIRGTQGPQGLQGPRGQDGAVIIGEGAEVLTGEGPPSNDIGAINQLYLNTLTGDLYKKNESETWDLLANLKGPKGDDGTQGVDGETGPPGPPGVSGYNGWVAVLALVEDGQRRVVRVTDWTGGNGPKPASGSYVGESGFVADLVNAVNIRGPQGVPGTQGTKGDTGSSIHAMSRAPVAGDGNNGDAWIDGTNGYLYRKASGAWTQVGIISGPQGPKGEDSTVPGPPGDTGPQGPEGPQGPKGDDGADSMVPGPAGTSIYTATSNPQNVDGNTGDSWINSLTGNIYLKTGASTWTLMGNLKGPQGEPGNEGPQGPAGQLDENDFATASELLVGSAHKVAAADTMLDALAWQTITYASTLAPNMNNFVNGSITLTGDMTLNVPTNVKAGRQVAIKLQGNNANERTVTFGMGYVGDTDELVVTNESRVVLYVHALGGGEFLVAARAF